MDHGSGWPPPEARPPWSRRRPDGWPPARPPGWPPRRRGPWLNAVLLLATTGTTLLAGFAIAAPADTTLSAADVLRHGWPYAAALLGILGSHEMGHWVLARRHGVDVTLPFFIPGPPFPVGVGTFGAVIRMRSPPPSRRAALDIGLAGPLAGLVVALPLLVWGLAHSTLAEVGQLPAPGPSSLVEILAAWLRDLPEPEAGPRAIVLGDSLLTWGLQRLIWGALPPGRDLLLHPVALAGWLGLLVTALNLFPLGQLDGGHGTFALLGRERALRLSRLVSWGLLGCGLFLSASWLVWWALTRFLVGLGHPPAWDERPLDPARRAVAIAGLVLFVLTFVPVPIAS